MCHLPALTHPIGDPAITLDFTDSETVAYDLLSFFFGCALGTEENVSSEPVNCTFTLTGYGPLPSTRKRVTRASSSRPIMV